MANFNPRGDQKYTSLTHTLLSATDLLVREQESEAMLYPIQRTPCLGPDNTVGDKAMSTLKSAHCGLCLGSEVAVYSNSDFCLNLLS